MKTQETIPIFIFSLPRAGSTLLQRVLAVHDQISTVAEPWILLPFVYAQRDFGVYSEYIHASSSKAINDIVAQLPNGSIDYFKSIRKMALSIYNDLNKGNAKYFLDKTPRYYLIIEEISKIFPEAKFIFLFRSPLANLASMIQTFHGGRLGDYRHSIDIFQGPVLLAEGFKRFNRPAYKVNYENLIQNPKATIKSVCKFLEIPFFDEMLSGFHHVKFSGKMGDSTGIKQYNSIEKEPLVKWVEVFRTKYRKSYAKKYLDYLGRDCIHVFGYDRENLINELDKIDTVNNFGFVDRYNNFKCFLYSLLEVPIIKLKMRNILSSNQQRQFISY